MLALPFTIPLGRPSRGELLTVARGGMPVADEVARCLGADLGPARRSSAAPRPSWVSTTAQPQPAASEEPLAGGSLHVNSTPGGAVGG